MPPEAGGFGMRFWETERLTLSQFWALIGADGDPSGTETISAMEARTRRLDDPKRAERLERARRMKARAKEEREKAKQEERQRVAAEQAAARERARAKYGRG